MHNVSGNPHHAPGYLLPEEMYTLLHDVADELELLAGLTATSHPLDGELQTLPFKRAGLASYLRGAHGRIDAALQACRYPARRCGSHDSSHHNQREVPA